MDAKKAAQIERAARQTVDTLWLRKEQDRINQRRLIERLRQEKARLYASLRRMANGMHTGDYDDAAAALAEADALLWELGEED